MGFALFCNVHCLSFRETRNLMNVFTKKYPLNLRGQLKRSKVIYLGRDLAICKLRKITGIIPTNTMANAGAAASDNRSSDAY